MNLLIVEDEYRELAFLKKFIETHFSTVLSIVAATGNGKDALIAIEHFSIDLALLDIEVPIFDGLSIAQHLKKKQPNSRIIMLTAYSSFQYAHQALRIGVNDYLVKPYLSEELENIINQVIGFHPQQVPFLRSIPFLEHEPEHPLVRIALPLIIDHFSSDLLLSELAALLNVSDDHLGKCLKKDLSIGFSELLGRYRIFRAQELLSKENLSAAEVAQMVGFSDPNYFYKSFKKYTGMSAKTYANLHLGKKFYTE